MEQRVADLSQQELLLVAEARLQHEMLQASRLEHLGSRDGHGLTLKRDEVVYARVVGVGFIEPKRLPSQWQGGSRGVSFRVAKGVRYRVGATRGHVVPGEEVNQITDRGEYLVTSQRAAFRGEKRTTEWLYSKLIGFSVEGDGQAVFSVQNRTKTTGVMYGPEYEGELDGILLGAIARFQGGDEGHQEVIGELVEAYADAYGRWRAAADDVAAARQELQAVGES
jgi:hypothetical protein